MVLPIMQVVATTANRCSSCNCTNRWKIFFYPWYLKFSFYFLLLYNGVEGGVFGICGVSGTGGVGGGGTSGTSAGLVIDNWLRFILNRIITRDTGYHKL